MTKENPVFTISDLNFYYGEKRALSNINMNIMPRKVTALIGPSGCGKSTYLRCLNRMNDTIEGTRVEGKIRLHGEDIYSPFGPRVLGLAEDKTDLSETVEQSLRQAALWDEVKDDLKLGALSLSLGQQQRLCIARVVAVQPEVILMDESTSALDPISTGHVEDLIAELKKDYTIVIVTHNMQQAARVSDKTGLFWLGDLVEFSETTEMFTNPKEELTEAYITGRMG